MMGSLKEILLHCQENEKEFAKYEAVSRDRDVNKGWIECCECFLRNFYLTEKRLETVINEMKGEKNDKSRDKI